jgi:putative transposase
MVCKVGGRRMYLWRAIDDEGGVLDLMRRDTGAALRLIKRLLRNRPVEPERIVTDGLGSYPATLSDLGFFTFTAPGASARTTEPKTATCPFASASARS